MLLVASFHMRIDDVYMIVLGVETFIAVFAHSIVTESPKFLLN